MPTYMGMGDNLSKTKGTVTAPPQMCSTTYTRTCNSPQSNDTDFQSPEQDKDFSNWFLQMSDSHCVPLLFTRSDVEMSGHQIGGQVSKNSQGARSLSRTLSLALSLSLSLRLLL